MITRRSLLAGSIAAALAPATAGAQRDAGSALREVVLLGARLERRELTPLAWQDAIERALRGADTAGLAALLDVERLRARAPAVARGAAVVIVPPSPSIRASRHGALKLFFLEPGRSNPPHAHDNMVSAHLVLSGRIRVRHFARVRDEPDAIVIRGPTIDRVLGPGELTTVSDHRDNVHWHTALERTVLFDVVQGRLDPSRRPRDRTLLDPDRGHRLADGTVRAPRLALEDALARYG